MIKEEVLLIMKQRMSTGQKVVIALVAIAVLLYLRAWYIDWNTPESKVKTPEDIRLFFEETVYVEAETESETETESKENSSETEDITEEVTNVWEMEVEPFGSMGEDDDLSIYLIDPADGEKWRNGNGSGEKKDLTKTVKAILEKIGITNIEEIYPVKEYGEDADFKLILQAEKKKTRVTYTYATTFGYAAMSAKMFFDDDSYLFGDMISAYKDPENDYYRYEFGNYNLYREDRAAVIVDGVNCIAIEGWESDDVKSFVEECRKEGLWRE